MKTIVLAHGVLGFSSLGGLLSFVSYFNGVANHLHNQGHKVIVTDVDRIGSVRQRGEMLAAAILRQAPAGERVHIIAHSMGGLDARHAIAHVNGFSARVATLVTIGTPHLGSPVADAIQNGVDPLLRHIPPILRDQLQNNAPALHDLTTQACTAFDRATPDAPGVRYMEIAGDASQGGRELLLFEIAAAIGQIKNEANDGVVTMKSALRGGRQPFAVWPVDHAGEVGWSFDSPLPILFKNPLLPTPAHLLRYDEIVQAL